MGIQLRGWYCLLRFSVVRLRYTGSRPSRRMRRQSCSVTPQRMHRHRAPSLCRAECWAARTPPDLTGSELFRAGRKTPAGRGVGRAAEYSAERVPRYDQHAWAALTEPGLRSWWQQACGVHSERGEMQEVQGGGATWVHLRTRMRASGAGGTGPDWCTQVAVAIRTFNRVVIVCRDCGCSRPEEHAWAG